MSDSQNQNLPPAPEPPQGRRDFFGDALRGALGPLSHLLERKINPLLQALDSLPTDEPPAPPSLDQPQLRTLNLPLHPAPHSIARSPSNALQPRLPDRLLRPPGALPPDAFEAACSRCNKCVEVCPAQAIKIDPNGLIGEGFPYIVAAEMPCVVCDSLACMNACPSGALTLVDKFHIHMGLAKVNQATCLRANGEDCRLCVQACPLGDHAITISDQSGKVRVKRHGCIGCGLCESACPTEPRSIFVQPLEPHPDPLIA